MRHPGGVQHRVRHHGRATTSVLGGLGMVSVMNSQDNSFSTIFDIQNPHANDVFFCKGWNPREARVGVFGPVGVPGAVFGSESSH